VFVMHDLLEVLPRCDWSTLAHLAGPSRNILRHLQQGFTTRKMEPLAEESQEPDEKSPQTP